MDVVFQIDGHDAISVRAVLSVTCGNVTPQQLALELSQPDSERKFSAYRYSQGSALPVRAEAWGAQHELLTGIVRAFKREEPEFENPERDQHREAAWRKSLELLPAGVFVWLDEFKKWYDEKTYYSPHSVWEEQHRVVGEDDDPEPQFQLKHQTDTLDLSPIVMCHCEELICEGFEAWFGNQNDSPNMVAAAQAKTAPARDTATLASMENDEIDFTVVATRKNLIDAFGTFTGMDMTWFDNLKDTPKLMAARKFMGQGGRGGAEPLFCPYEVMQWLADPKRRKGKSLTNETAWRLFKRNFGNVYNRYSVGDPNPD